MKIHYAPLALAVGAAIALSSCAAPYAGYMSYNSPVSGLSAGVAWKNASYDASGFPIFGYAYGRPVYGYTPSGAAIFSIAGLTALSYVPQWSPAAWYRGSFRYPVGIHRVVKPPHYPVGHAPHVRPPEIHHVGHAPHVAPHPAPQVKHNWQRPGSNVAPQRPGWSQPGRAVPRPVQHAHHAGHAMHNGAHNGMHQHVAGHAARPGANNGGALPLPGTPSGHSIVIPHGGPHAGGRR